MLPARRLRFGQSYRRGFVSRFLVAPATKRFSLNCTGLLSTVRPENYRKVTRVSIVACRPSNHDTTVIRCGDHFSAAPGQVGQQWDRIDADAAAHSFDSPDARDTLAQLPVSEHLEVEVDKMLSRCGCW